MSLPPARKDVACCTVLIRKEANVKEVVGEETRLPMVICRICKRARMREARSKKENENISQVYIKCSVSGFSFDFGFVLSDL